MNKNTSDFFIVDFTASRKYFHQYPLIIGISKFLKKNGYNSRILLPSVADREENSLPSNDVNFMLDSGFSSRNYKPLRHFLHKMLTNVSDVENSHNQVKSYLRRRYVKSALKFFKKYKKNNITSIVFPTLDPLSLELAIGISKLSKMKGYFFYFRITGSESRGILSSNKELEILLSLVKRYPKKIKIGIETIGYKVYLEDLGFNPISIFWSPWPCLEDLDQRKMVGKEFLIGFLGCAKQRKGFDHIPEILNHLKSEGFAFSILVQEANFPWPEYQTSKKRIEELMHRGTRFLPSNLNLIDLQEYIKMCDLLILPYDSNSYSINASGVLYHACDSKLPIIAAKGVGFESEIIEFNLGLLYNNFKEIPDLVKKIQSTSFGFDNYNFNRNQANISFLLNNSEVFDI